MTVIVLCLFLTVLCFRLQCLIVVLLSYRNKLEDYHDSMLGNKVRKKANIRNQIPHLTHDPIWESGKSTRKHHIQEKQVVSPFQASSRKAVRNIQYRMTDSMIDKHKT